MSITTTTLTRTAGLSAIAAGLLFIGVQINHPQHMDAEFATTAEYTIRHSMKILMAVFSLIGITGMYLPHVKKMGVLGFLGYLVFGAGYLIMMSVLVIAAVVLPAIAVSTPEYVNDVLAVATGGQAAGDVGLLAPLCLVMGFTFLGGGLIFGIALFRANVLARWAALLLSFGSLATIAIPLLPMVNYRLFAIPTGVALIGLGWSLWRKHRTASTSTHLVAGAPLGSGAR